MRSAGRGRVAYPSSVVVLFVLIAVIVIVVIWHGVVPGLVSGARSAEFHADCESRNWHCGSQEEVILAVVVGPIVDDPVHEDWKVIRNVVMTVRSIENPAGIVGTKGSTFPVMDALWHFTVVVRPDALFVARGTMPLPFLRMLVTRGH